MQLASLSVCLSVRLHLNKQDQISPNFRRTWPWLSPLLTAMQYVMYFRFYGCHVFT